MFWNCVVLSQPVFFFRSFCVFWSHHRILAVHFLKIFFSFYFFIFYTLYHSAAILVKFYFNQKPYIHQHFGLNSSHASTFSHVTQLWYWYWVINFLSVCKETSQVTNKQKQKQKATFSLVQSLFPQCLRCCPFNLFPAKERKCHINPFPAKECGVRWTLSLLKNASVTLTLSLPRNAVLDDRFPCLRMQCHINPFPAKCLCVPLVQFPATKKSRRQVQVNIRSVHFWEWLPHTVNSHNS